MQLEGYVYREKGRETIQDNVSEPRQMEIERVKNKNWNVEITICH